MANEPGGWPRYNQGGDAATFNGVGNHGYGAYGENVGIGQLDGDPQLEVVVTYDNHLVNVFNHDGTSVLASPWYRTARAPTPVPPRVGPVHPVAEPARQGPPHAPPHRAVARHQNSNAWLQWTASPPSIADLDRDGRDEVIGLPNVERHRALRDPVLRVRRARQRAGRRRPVGPPPPRLRAPCR